MSHSISRRFVLTLTIMAISVTGAVADTFSIVKRVCPICSTNYETAVTNSQSINGLRLDLRPIGGVVSPPRIGVCTKCGFVDYRHGEKYPQDELAISKSFVESDEFRKLAAVETPYYRAARVYGKLERSPDEIATFLLYSIWEAENKKDDALLARYLREFLAQSDRVLDDERIVGEKRQTQMILKGEMLRRLGKFDDAEAHFAALAGDEGYRKAPFPDLIRQERDLIRVKNNAPQAFDPRRKAGD